MALIPTVRVQPQAAEVVHEVHSAHGSEKLSQRVLAMFLAGFIVGVLVASLLAGVDDCGGAVYSPVRYYRMLSQM